MLSKTIPGTNINFNENDDAFSIIREMIDITGGFTLSQVCKITGLQSSTIQNWVKRAYVQRPVNKKYYERHISRILLISALRECMNIEDIGDLMEMINGDTEDESDDIISESRLFDYFCRALRNLDDLSLRSDNIDKIVDEVLKNEAAVHHKRLEKALKVMVYAYISGKCLEQINANLRELRKVRR